MQKQNQNHQSLLFGHHVCTYMYVISDVLSDLADLFLP